MKTAIKKSIKFILIVGTFVAGLHFIFLQWSFNSFLPQVKNYLTDHYFLNVKSIGNIKVKLLPWPKIVITNIELSQSYDRSMIFVPETEIKINFLELFTTEKILDLQSMSIHHPQIKVYNDIPVDLIKDMFLKQVQHNLSSKISVVNGTFQVIDDTEVVIKEMKNLHLSYSRSCNKNLKITISFNEDGNSHSFLLDAKDLDEALSPTSLIVSVKYNLLHLYAKLYRNLKSNALLGKASIHLYDKIDTKTDIEKFFCQQNFKKIEVDVELNKELLKIHNFTTTSTNIQDIKGSASYYVNSNTLNFNIEIDNLNLDSILMKFYGTKKADNFDIMDLLDFITTKRNLAFTKFVTTSANLHINKLFYKQDNIDNFKLNFSFWPSQKPNRRKILINNLSMVLPGSSKFEIYGVMLNDQVPIFRGQTSFISNKPKDLLLWYYKNPPPNKLENTPIIVKSGIIFMPYVLQLHDIQLASKNINMLVDVLALNYPGPSDLQIYTEIIANKINLDHLNLDDKLNDLIYILYSSDFDNSGKAFSKKTDNLNFIRSQKGFKNFTVETKELTINDQLFYGFNVNIDINNHYLRLDHLHADSRLASYTGSIQLDLFNMKPTLDVNLVFSKLDSKLFKIMLPTQTTLKERYQKQLSLQEDKNNATKIGDINFYGINNFNGKFNITMDKLYTKDVDFNNVQLLGSIVNGGIKIDNINAQGFNGNIKVTGNISTLRPVFSLECGVGLDNINPSLLLNYLINNNNNVGYMSSSGVLSSKGANREDFIKNLNGQFRIQGKNIKYNNFGILELIELPQLEIPYNEKLKRLNYYKRYGESQFDDVTGDLIIRNGIAETLSMQLNNKRTSDLLNFIYSFIDNSLSGNAKFSFIPKEGEKSILINVHSTGDVSKAQVKVDTSDLEQYLKKKNLSKSVQH